MNSNFFSNRRSTVCGLIGFLAYAAASCGAQPFTIAADHTNGVYELGQTAHWRVEGTNQTPTNIVKYSIKRGGLTEIASGELTFTNGAAALESTLDQPGTLLAEVRWGKGPRARALAGAVVAREQIAPSTNCPADFDAFWAAKLDELRAVPAEPQLEPGATNKPGVDYWKITMNNIRGTHIHGQLARPHEGDKFPALLIVQWAGVYPLQKSWVLDRAASGWLALNIEAHDLPIDEPEAFYHKQFDGPLKNYWNIGNDDRDQSYFLRMYLSCYRAAEYLTGRPDWNGKTLVAMGDSQGGLQTLMIAGLHPKITGALALVPAGCDMLGPQVGRRGGWPQWADNTEGKDAAKVWNASRYYDVVNFAARIHCPALVGLGLIDETCPPAGVFAAINQINAPKEVVILAKSGHGTYALQAPFTQRKDKFWLPALRDGNPPPITP